MKDIQIIRGKEFKAHVGDKIDGNDLFLDEYRKGTHLLEEILHASNEWMETVGHHKTFDKNNHTEYNNNIIAFCGERGDGKSSAMLTFINAIEHPDKVDMCNLFQKTSIVKKTRFVDKIHIDPSALDNVHSILDLVVANMFRHFKKKYEEESKQENVNQRNELIQCFQKVYRALSLKKDSKLILNEEFDDEGSIAKLSKLSESMRLKEYMLSLVRAYFEYMSRFSEGNDIRSNVIIIAIDDLDLNVSAAYSMSEDIRKYLILPGIVIFMAIRIKQLRLAIEECNVRRFRNKFKVNHSYQMRKEIQEMAEKYVSKLIPLAHRVNLPKIQDVKNVRIVYREYDLQADASRMNSDENGVEVSVVQIVLKKIYEKTGMIILPFTQGYSLILPDNIRGMVNLVVFLEDLEEPVGNEQDKKKILNDNIIRILNSYYWELVDNLPENNKREEIVHQELVKITDYDVSTNLHAAVCMLLDKLYDAPPPTENLSDQFRYDTNLDINSMTCIMNMIRRLTYNNYEIETKRYLSAISFLYTIKLNLLLTEDNGADELKHFTNHIIWGYEFLSVLPAVRYSRSPGGFSRGRFELLPSAIYNCIIYRLRMPTNYYLNESNPTYVSPKISTKPEERKKYIIAWILFGMFCNSFDHIRNSIKPRMLPFVPFVHRNYLLNSTEQVSIENFVVRMCMLDRLYDQLNLDLFGVDKDEFKNIVNELKEKNELMFEISKRIVCNVDVIQEIIRYCANNNEYKKKTEDEFDRSKKLVETFLGNLISFFEEKNYKIQLSNGSTDFATIQYFRYGEGDSDVINIAELYADFIQKALEIYADSQKDNARIDRTQVSEVLDALEMKGVDQKSYVYFANYVQKDAKLKVLKDYLMHMSKNIGKYMLLSGNSAYLSDEYKKRICDLYEEVISGLQKNGEGKVSGLLRERYRGLTRQFPPKFLKEQINSLLEKNNS